MKRSESGGGNRTVGSMILFIVILCFCVASSLVIEANEAEVPTPNCSILKQQKPLQYINESNKYGLWPGLRNSNDLKTGRTTFAFEEVPPRLLNAKILADLTFLLFLGYGSHLAEPKSVRL